MRSKLSIRKTKQLAQNVKRMRKRKKLTPSELSARIYRTRTYMYNIENGTSAPSLCILVEMAKVLRCTVSDLVKGL